MDYSSTLLMTSSNFLTISSTLLMTSGNFLTISSTLLMTSSNFSDHLQHSADYHRRLVPIDTSPRAY